MKTKINGLGIYYEILGKENPIVILHGWQCESGVMRPVAEFIHKQTGRQVINLDLPGFGYSDTPEDAWGISDFCEFLKEFLASMQIPSVTLLGHSLGGRISIKFAAQNPEQVRKIILVDSAGILPKRTAAYHIKVAWVKFVKKLKPILGEKMIGWMMKNAGSEDYRNAGKMRGTLVKTVNEDLKPYLPLIQCPALLIWGEKDNATPLSDGRLMQTLIPQSELMVIPGAGHFSFLDDPKTFQSFLLPFIQLL